MQLIAFEAADAYGDKAAARRWAEKYLRLVQKNFDKTGDLWEKYNGVTGTLETVNEYGLPRMMGWTAGVFVCAAKYLSGK
jgi:alpha,alpha-trehalase